MYGRESMVCLPSWFTIIIWEQDTRLQSLITSLPQRNVIYSTELDPLLDPESMERDLL